ncbi:A-kinase anchor protein 17A [Armadillidium nasatum]|uniref:A-kinase anchor protein 17A n=1 Tax=Armadillidium nasatum TaxID=96803 RepID=A0A5N5SIP6_9CRUS|nr:A-kinase anchor protein 17A [Armadillidium nasatum]
MIFIIQNGIYGHFLTILVVRMIIPLELFMFRAVESGIKLSGFTELLKIRAVEGKIPFPSRHDWDSFFRDAKHMNEMKPGERPDTIHFQDLPCRWFAHVEDHSNQQQPSEFVLKKVFQTFGEIRVIDIPCLDIYRKQMSSSVSGMSTFSFNEDVVFEAYVQFKEYIGFAKCMHGFQGKKLVLIVDKDKAWSTNIKVDFDKTKHLSEYSIKKRMLEREKLLSIQREREEKEEIDKGESGLNGQEKLSRKIALEERKLLIAQRKLESIRLLDELFARIKVYHRKEVMTLRAMEGENKENVKDEDKKISETIPVWFDGKCKKAINIRNYFRKKLENNPDNNEVSIQYEKAKLHAKTVLRKAKKAFMEKEEKIPNDMVVKEKKLREKLVNSLKMQQQQAMVHQQKKVEKVVRGKMLNKSADAVGNEDTDLSDSSDLSSSSSDTSSLSEEEKENEETPTKAPQANENNQGGFNPNGPNQWGPNQWGPNQWGNGPNQWGPQQNFPGGPNYMPSPDELKAFYDNRGRGRVFRIPETFPSKISRYAYDERIFRPSRTRVFPISSSWYAR